MRFTCRECPDSAFVMRFTRFEACQVMRFTCRECPDSAFVLCITQFDALPGDAIHLQEVSGFSISIVFYTV